MRNLNGIGEELFNKIRGRFSNVTIGDRDANVVDDPSQARFIEFEYKEAQRSFGKVSVSLSEENGVVITYGEDFIGDDNDYANNGWFDFLRELRSFAKKRLMKFDIRDISKSNLQKRDYKFLAKNNGEATMSESKFYGTARKSYQKVGEAKVVINHSRPIDAAVPGARSRAVGTIFIESPTGERFKYPYKHLNGARAMARHVSEGGIAYDDFGKHIVSLSEELSKLGKFKSYLGRSKVMAESLSGYMDVVYERIADIKKRTTKLQNESYYKEAYEGFEPVILENVPSEVESDWVDQLTIKQFNEELKDVFPYIYGLVSEHRRVVALSPEDMMSESDCECEPGCDCDACTEEAAATGTKNKGKKHPRDWPKSTPEAQFEQGLEDVMGNFSEKTVPPADMERFSDGDPNPAEDLRPAIAELISDNPKATPGELVELVARATEVKEYLLFDMSKFKSDILPILHDELKKFQQSEDDGDPGEYNEPSDQDHDDYGHDHGYSSDEEDEWDLDDSEFDKFMNHNADDQQEEPPKPQVPLSEYILSMYDRETSKFPKGETAILTAVEKDYGEQYIEPAKQFIEKVYSTTEAFNGAESVGSYTPQMELESIRLLSGLGTSKLI